MAIALVIDNPEGSQEIYEKVRAQLGLAGAAGGIFMRPDARPERRLARRSKYGESQEDAMRLPRTSASMPAFDAAGVPRPPGRPEIWQLHDYMK